MTVESPTSRINLPPLAEGLPGNTRVLIAMLDREYPQPVADTTQLHEEKYRLQLAAEQGQRDLVNRLLTLQKRQEQPNV